MKDKEQAIPQSTCMFQFDSVSFILTHQITTTGKVVFRPELSTVIYSDNEITGSKKEGSIIIS